MDWSIHSTTILDWINLYLQQAYFPNFQKQKRPETSSLPSTPKGKLGSRSAFKTPSPKAKQESKSGTRSVPGSPSEVCGFGPGAGLLPLEKIDIIHKYFPDEILVQMMQLCDLTLLDLETNRYHERFIAAAILYHFSTKKIVERATGFKIEEIRDSIQHVTKFALVIKGVGFKTGKDFSGSKVDRHDWVHIQTHTEQLQTVMDLLF